MQKNWLCNMVSTQEAINKLNKFCSFWGGQDNFQSKGTFNDLLIVYMIMTSTYKINKIYIFFNTM